MILDLFPPPDFRLQRIGSTDARRSTDALKLLTMRLVRHEQYYPSIDNWVSKKVIPDLKAGRRIGYLGFRGDVPVLVAVLKQGTKAKFCHLSIESGFQGSKLGHLMFSLMAARVRNNAQEVHFTLPESLWEREKGFFKAFGFRSTKLASTQYRLFEQELRCSVPFAVLWSHVLKQLPVLLTSPLTGYQVNDGVVLSVHEERAHAIMDGRKTVELRKRFSERWIGRCASVYAARGTGCLLGKVIIEDVIKAKPAEIWERFNQKLHCSRSEFNRYAGERAFLYAIRLSNPQPYEAPIPLSQLSQLIGQKLSPPQSYSTHSKADAWSKALSIAALLPPSSPATHQSDSHQLLTSADLGF
jgi:predicted transcriptional regulator